MASTEDSEQSVAQVVVAAPQLVEAIDFLVGQDFRLEQIFPADDPAVAVVAGFGLVLRLERDAPPMGESIIRIAGRHEPATVRGPNDLTLRFVAASEALDVPDLAPAFVLTKTAGDEQVGRAGMVYRDLIPDRLGGRFIASHITIVDGGPVPDYVHHHHIRFQMIFCHRGWVDVVYEDQGPAFRMEPGDCVLQPPHIRHRVLASSANCQVVEIGCPAVHATIADHSMELPTAVVDGSRDFGGQRFVRHRAAASSWKALPGDWAGWVASDTGIGDATSGLAGARVVRSGSTATQATFGAHADEFRFHFVRAGRASLVVPGHFDGTVDLDDSFVIPAGQPWRLHQATPDFELLEVAMPAQ